MPKFETRDPLLQWSKSKARDSILDLFPLMTKFIQFGDQKVKEKNLAPEI